MGGRVRSTGPALLHGRLVRYGIPALFFGCFFVFLLRYIDPAVIYSANGVDIRHYVAVSHAREASGHAARFASPPFGGLFILELTPAYFGEIASEPGGLVRLAVTLCIYACHYPVAGALAVTGIAFFFFWIFSLYLQGTGGARPFVVRFIAPLFLLTACAWYELRYCAFLLPVAGALGFAVVYQRLRPGAAVLRALWLSLLFWLAWYLLQWGCLLFLLFALIHDRRRIAPVLLASAVNGTLLGLLDALLLPLDATIRWKEFLTLSGLPLAAIGFFPVAAIVLAAAGRLIRPRPGRPGEIGSVARIGLVLAGSAAVGAWLVANPVNRDTRTVARTVHHALSGQWEAVLDEKTAALFNEDPARAGIVQEFMVQAVDHALCRTGGLGDRLFAFPQPGFDSDQLMMLEGSVVNGYANWVMVLDLAMDLGMVNLAEKTAGEIMENMGPFPDILYRRALIQAAKGNREAAAVYLNKLAGMPFHRGDAKRLLAVIGDDRALLAEPRIAAMRADRDTVDYLLVNVDYEAVFKHLLQSNLGNRAAFDYLMTFYLLNKLPDGVASLAPGASSFGYAVLPRYWQEALCIAQVAGSMHGGGGVAVSGLQQQTVERFNEFARACARLKDDPAIAAKLEADFGDSYYYYYAFGQSHGAHHE